MPTKAASRRDLDEVTEGRAQPTHDEVSGVRPLRAGDAFLNDQVRVRLGHAAVVRPRLCVGETERVIPQAPHRYGVTSRYSLDERIGGAGRGVLQVLGIAH